MKKFFVTSFVFGFFAFLIPFSDVNAVTGSFYRVGPPALGGSPMWDISLNFSTNKDVYAPGEPIIITGTKTSNWCYNGYYDSNFTSRVPCTEAQAKTAWIHQVAFGVDPSVSAVANPLRSWNQPLTWDATGAPIYNPAINVNYPGIFYPISMAVQPTVTAMFPWDGSTPAIFTATVNAPLTSGAHEIVARSVFMACWGMCIGEDGYYKNNITIQVQSGAVNVTSNISSASWSLSGAKAILGTGLSFSASGQPVGEYTITWNSVAGYTAPPPQSLSLSNNGTISFNGNYQLNECQVGSPASFQPKTTYPTDGAGASVAHIASGNFNGDDKSDLVLENSASGKVYAFINKGDGTFNSGVAYTGGSSMGKMGVGDVNGDGRDDIAVVNSPTNIVSVLINNNNSAGTFAPKVNYWTGSYPSAVTIGDVNNDGKPDMVVTNNNASTVSVFINNGSGTFAPKADYSAGAGPHEVSVADINGDNEKDLIISNYSGVSNFSVLINNGNGIFSSRVAYGGLGITNTTGISVGDVNGDNSPDIALQSFASTKIFVFKNNGDGTFGAGVGYELGDSFAGVGIKIVDLNKDGANDIVATRYLKVSALINDGAGIFSSIIHFEKSTFIFGVYEWDLDVLDLNNDGKMDIAYSGGFSTMNVMVGKCVPPLPPTIPINLIVTPLACGTSQNFLDWDDASNATSYSIYDSTGTWIGNSIGSTYTHTGNPSTAYSYYVRANNSAGVQSGNSIVVSGVTPTTCPLPCINETIENCEVVAMSSGGMGGMCTIGGFCQYTCNNGTWEENNNSCTIPQCSNGSDDDSDGFIDFVGGDLGCSDAFDNTEFSVTTPPDLTASPRTVQAGSDTTLTWTLNGQTGCSLTGGSLGNTYNGTLNSTDSLTLPVLARTTYTLTCPVGSDTTMVEVVPVGTET